MNSGQQMALAGVREIPGLLLMFIAALSMHLPLTWRAAVSVVIMGIGYALYAVVNSYVALLAVAVVGSLGFHSWMPLTSSLALGLTTKAHSGKVLGSLASIGALASITALLVSFAFSNFVPRDHFPLRTFLAAGGVSMIVGGLLIVRLPKHIGKTTKEQPRLLFRRRYWLYYVLTFFEGSRTQVFGAFNLLVLVQYYHWDVYHITALLAASGLVNFLLARRLGHFLDHIGELPYPRGQLCVVISLLCGLRSRPESLALGRLSHLHQSAGHAQHGPLHIRQSHRASGGIDAHAVHGRQYQPHHVGEYVASRRLPLE